MDSGGLSASSPTTVVGQGHHRNGSALGGLKRKRSGLDFESSPGSAGEQDDAEEAERRRQPGVKRACNECRQQKVSYQCLYHCSTHTLPLSLSVALIYA